MTTFADSKTRIANIRVTTKDVIKNWWKLNYFDAGQPIVINLGPNILPNAGGENTTDWVDSNSDGLADRWGGSERASIITGNGFSGRAQRMSATAGGVICNLGMTGSWLADPSAGLHRYKIRFSYRCFDNRSNPAARGMTFRWFNSDLQQSWSSVLAPNTGSAITVEFDFEVSNLKMVGFGCGSEDVQIVEGQYWYEVGEINLYEYL